MKISWNPFRDLLPFASFPEMAKRGTMRYTMLFTGLMMACWIASSQALTLAEVKGSNAVQLSTADLQQMLPGTKVVNQGPTGGTRHWVNSPGGSLAASSSGEPGMRATVVSGSGSWKMDDKGTYCVHILWSWHNSVEDWCRYIFKSGDKYYAFDTLEDTAQASEFGFSK
jgi:hypothetical protein